MPQIPEQLLHGLGLVLIYLAAQGVKAKNHSRFHQIQQPEFVQIVKSPNCIFYFFCYNGSYCDISPFCVIITYFPEFVQ